MGKRGQRPVPTQVLKLRGSWRANTRRGEPETTGSLAKPKWLTGERATAKWDELAVLIGHYCGEQDSGALARYCYWWSKWDEISGAGGDNVQRLGQIQQILTRAEQEFGLTPSARTAIHVPSKAGENNLEGKYFGKTG